MKWWTWAVFIGAGLAITACSQNERRFYPYDSGYGRYPAYHSRLGYPGWGYYPPNYYGAGYPYRYRHRHPDYRHWSESRRAEYRRRHWREHNEHRQARSQDANRMRGRLEQPGVTDPNRYRDPHIKSKTWRRAAMGSGPVRRGSEHSGRSSKR